MKRPILHLNKRPDESLESDVKIRIKGYYFIKPARSEKKEDKETKKWSEPNLIFAKLDTREFIYSCREFKLGNLEILPMERYWPGVFVAEPLVGVVDIEEGSLIPFFITRQKAKKLSQLLKNVKTRSIFL